MTILGSCVMEWLTTTDLRSTLLKLVVAVIFLTIFFVYFIKPSFSINFIQIGIVEQKETKASSSGRNLSTWTNTLIISKINVSTNSVVKPVISLKTTPCPTTRKTDQVMTGPLYMTAVFKGRLGNQLFIYASLLGIASAQNRTAFIGRGTLLESAFEITHVNKNISTYGFVTVREAKYATFDPRLLNLSKDNFTLAGFLQVWKYFRNVDEYLRRQLKFRAFIRTQINDILDQIRRDVKGHVLVGVHVRRGDFLSGGCQRLGYGVGKASYFLKAFDKMRSLLKSTNVTFVVASDDLKWCQENLNFTDVKLLEPGSAVLHFGVLANCDHVILAGGTYGWWSAWLANGITIYYDKFLVNGTALMRGANLQDYYPPEWIAVGD